MLQRHHRHHHDDADEDQVIDLTDRLAPYGLASEAAPAGAKAAPAVVVPTHAAILSALVDHVPRAAAPAGRAGAGRS